MDVFLSLNVFLHLFRIGEKTGKVNEINVSILKKRKRIATYEGGNRPAH